MDRLPRVCILHPMRFEVSHATEYIYEGTVSESFSELRVWPQSNDCQRVLERSISVDPESAVITTWIISGIMEFFSVPYRHEGLKVEARSEVETFGQNPSSVVLETRSGR